MVLEPTYKVYRDFIPGKGGEEWMGSDVDLSPPSTGGVKNELEYMHGMIRGDLYLFSFLS